MKSSPWTCAKEGGPFAVGVAWKGSLCYDNRYSVDGGSNNGKGFRTSINSWVTSDLGLAIVINTLTTLFYYSSNFVIEDLTDVLSYVKIGNTTGVKS